MTLCLLNDLSLKYKSRQKWYLSKLSDISLIEDWYYSRYCLTISFNNEKCWWRFSFLSLFLSQLFLALYYWDPRIIPIQLLIYMINIKSLIDLYWLSRYPNHSISLTCCYEFTWALVLLRWSKWQRIIPSRRIYCAKVSIMAKRDSVCNESSFRINMTA